MREIEVLAELKEDIKTACEVLSHLEFKGVKHTVDTYYFDEKRDNLQLNSQGKLMECCRLREKNGKFFVTYKTDNYDGETWIYSDEYETEIKDIKAMERIFECLGLKKLVIVDNKKYTFKTADYEIVLEEVENLGCFIEVEALVDDEKFSAEEIKRRIYGFIAGLGLNIGAELNSGKPEMLLNKKL